MTTVHDARVKAKSIVVGVVDDRCSGALAYALRLALEESARVRIVRVSSTDLSSRTGLGLPIETVEMIGDPVDVLLDESHGSDLLVVEAPRDARAALVDPMLVRLRQQTDTLLIEVDHRAEIVRASGPEGWSYPAGPDMAFGRPGASSRPDGVICVGVDSSPASQAAVTWAARMARPSLSALRLISVYGGSGSVVKHTKQDAVNAVDAAAALAPGIPTESLVVCGEPVDRLLDAAQGALMLVLGRHSTQTLLHNASPSVGDTCARLADCPVVVVPHR